MRKDILDSMSDFDNVHLKLDRILAGQGQTMARLDELDETVRVLIAAISVQREAVNTQTEVINRLAEAMSKEAGGGELAASLASIAVSLTKIQQDGARMVVLVGRLPATVAQAAQDAVSMALGDGIDIPPGDRE
jgi:hypothetical protein